MEAGLSSSIRTYGPFYGRDFLGQRVGITKLWHVAVVDITIVSSSFHTVGSAIYAGRRKTMIQPRGLVELSPWYERRIYLFKLQCDFICH